MQGFRLSGRPFRLHSIQGRIDCLDVKLGLLPDQVGWRNGRIHLIMGPVFSDLLNKSLIAGDLVI